MRKLCATGDQEKETARLEAIHEATLRHAVAAQKRRGDGADGAPELGGADALGDEAGPPRPPDGGAAEDDDADVGPPRCSLKPSI